MKFNVTVDIDYITDEMNIDEELQERIINALTKKIEHDFNEETGKHIAKTASGFVKAKVEMLVNAVLEKPVTISSGWGKHENYDSIYDMVEDKMTDLYEKKIKSSGNSCEKDPLLANVQNYIDKKVAEILDKTEKIVKTVADKKARQAVKESELAKALQGVVKFPD